MLVSGELERWLSIGRFGKPRRGRPARRRLHRLLDTVGLILTAAGVAAAIAACASGERASGIVRAQDALDRAAASVAIPVTQPAFGPGTFWYTRALQSTDSPSFRGPPSTVETWFGFDGTSRTRSGSQTPSVSGQDSVTDGYPDYGPGDGIGLSQALFTGAQLSALPSDIGQLRAAISAGETALTRQDNALKIQVQRTPGSATTQLVFSSKLTASQQRSLDALETAASLLAGPVSPGTRGALYRLIATLPGLRYDGEVRDALGRSGTAVSIGHGRDSATITFDPATGRLFSISIDGFLTQTVLTEGLTTSLATLPPGVTPAGVNAPAILAATVSPHVGAALTVFHLAQSTPNAPMQDTLQGPTAASCNAELFPGPSPHLSSGQATTVAISGLRERAYSYSFGPSSIGRRAWCPGQYQLQVTAADGGQATAYFDVK